MVGIYFSRTGNSRYAAETMSSYIRKHYIDNLRWIILLILIPYHTAMAWNTWGESNYVFFEGNRLISSIIVFFSPYFMPLLFVLAGVSTKFALQKRNNKEYLIERVKRLFVPCLFGTIVLMPIMTYIADKFNCSYSGGFLEHYAIFFTKYTDLIGADGGFSLGQFWFLLYLLIISVVGVGIITLSKRIVSKAERTTPFWLICFLGLPLPFLSELLSIGGKSLVEYTYLFMLGYYIFADEYGVTMAEYEAEYLKAGDGDRHYSKAFIGPENSFDVYKQNAIDDAKELAIGEVDVIDYDDVKIGEYVLKHFALSYSYEHELTANEVATWNSVLDFYYMELSADEALIMDFNATKLEQDNQNGELESERELELEIIPYMITNIEVEEAK